MMHIISFKTYGLQTNWSLLGPRVEISLMPNFIKGYSYFSPFNCWFIFFFYQVIECAMHGHNQEGTKQNFVSKPF